VSRGIGLETARLFLKEGAQILGVAKDAGRLEEAHTTLSKLGTFHSLAVNLTDTSAPSRIRNELTRLWGAVDLVIHNAGVMLAHTEEISREEPGKLEDSLETNLLAPYYLTRELLPLPWSMSAVAPERFRAWKSRALRRTDSASGRSMASQCSKPRSFTAKYRFWRSIRVGSKPI
jgi:NAD(P)-dependent dehydrogenase (short-subunit alcohol dehydrogenase family)